MGHIWIALTYLAPSCPRDMVTHTLQTIRQRARGPALILGDLNARHESWDVTGNTRGRALVHWNNQWAWRILAPSEATFATQLGQSTVDLFITHNLTTTTSVDAIWALGRC